MEKFMRIGAFSKKYNVPVSTVRYYIQCGYLIPEQQNGQYLFDERCRRDMEQIQNWKKMCFPLEDIHELLSFHRRYTYPLQEDLESYKAIYQRHLERLCAQQEELERQIEATRVFMTEE